MDNFEAFDGVFDFNSFINFPEDTNMESNNNVDFQFPTMDDFSTDVLNFSDMSPLPDLVFSQYDANVNSFDTSEYPASSVNESPLTANSDSFAPQAEDFRYLVDSRASADQRTRSMKQKRRDAAIDLHLERFMNLHSDAQLFPIDSEFSFSDTPSFTYSHESSRQSPVASTPVSSTSSSDQSTAPQVGGRELVFDINLNTATNLPKKQKKRTKAQIEDYINARRNGACLKHKKQHKKCNCHEKKAAKNTMDVKARKRRTPLSKAPVPTPGLMPNTPSETPSTVSRSSFSPSVYSQLDSQSFHEEIDSALASLDDLNDLERWVSLETYAPTADMSHQQYSQTESYGFSSPVHHRTVNTPVSTNLQTNVGYLAGGDESFNHLLGLTNDMSHGSLNTGQLVTTAGVPRLTEGTSSQTQNTSPVRTGVSLSSQHLLPNAPVQLSAPVQQGLPTTSVQVQPVTSPRRTEDSSALMWNNSPVRPGVALSSTLALPNAQQQPSTPVPQELSTGSSSGKPATSSLLPVSQGLPMETSVPVSNLPGWERQAGPLSTLPSRASLLSSQPSIGTASPVPSGLTEGQVALPQSALDILSTVLKPALQKSFGELQATNFVDEMFKDVSQTAFVAVQQYFSIFAAVLSAAYRMSELCVMALQGIDQVAMLFRSGLYNFAGERFLQRNLVTSTCALVHSTSLSPVRPLALHV